MMHPTQTAPEHWNLHERSESSVSCMHISPASVQSPLSVHNVVPDPVAKTTRWIFNKEQKQQQN